MSTLERGYLSLDMCGVMIGEEMEHNPTNIDKHVIIEDSISDKTMTRTITPIRIKVGGSCAPLVWGHGNLIYLN